MNGEHFLGLTKDEVPFDNPTRLQRMQHAYSTLFCGDFLLDLGFPIGSVGEIWDFVSIFLEVVPVQVVVVLEILDI